MELFNLCKENKGRISFIFFSFSFFFFGVCAITKGRAYLRQLPTISVNDAWKQLKMIQNLYFN